MRGLLILGGFLTVLIAVILFAFGWSLRQLPPVAYEQSVELEVDKRGAVYQGSRLVGLFRLRADGAQVLRLPLITPHEQQTPLTQSLLLTFNQKDAESVLQSQVNSIEGAGPFSVEWKNNSLLQVTLLAANPEGYPLLEIVAPSEYFSLPLFNVLMDKIANLAIWWWIGFGLLLLAGTLGYGALRTHQLSWRMAKERPMPPGDLHPLELAILHHGALTPVDLAAFLYNLVERGYVQLINHGEDEGVLFLKTSKEEGLSAYERNFLLLLFPEGTQPVRLQTVIEGLNQELFSAVVSQLYVDMYDSFSKRGFFLETPRAVHLRYKTVGILLQIAGLAIALLSLIFLMKELPGLVIVGSSFYLVGYIIYHMGYRIVPLSRLGNELVGQSAEFRSFLVNSEPLPWAAVQSNLFFQYVPYALVLGCGQEWLNRFREHTRWEIPEWYTDLENQLVHPDKFVNQIDAIGATLGMVMQSVRDPNVD